MAIYHHTTRMIGRSNGGNPVKALGYITGTEISDERTGEVFNFKDKSVEEVQILLPQDAPQWAKDLQSLVALDKQKGIQLLSNMANMSEKRIDAQVYREIEFSLPRELTYEQNKRLASEYVQDQFCGLGMLAIQSFHVERNEETGELNPHCHTFFLTRELVETGLSFKKNRDWNDRSVHEVWREQWAQYANFHLKMHGHDVTLDHRSYEDQGIDIEPQVKLGKGVLAQEKRAKAKEDTENIKDTGEKGLDYAPAGNGQGTHLCSLKEDSNLKINSTQEKGFVDNIPITDRMQELRSVRLRNLYRIMRRPETVFDIVTRHHATFMWGDVQKILSRYVDDYEVFQRLDARLRNSNELLLLKMEGVKDGSERIEEREIYTTRTMLKAEKALVSTAETLASNSTHGVSSSALTSGLERIQARLQKEGHSLSQDQLQAIHHLVGEGQLKCIVGYAGAGKTTALEACREIWEEEGYQVYGLAPTGRAAKNLEDSGISSMTLHKFLKSFEEGRCQYGEKSVIVLDEAGMVDVERFDKFLSAVNALGVKAGAVGDGAQLQPVEAGPAFRLVTERTGVSRLENVVRQRQEWQREATVLFGKQDSKAAIQEYQTRGRIHLVEEEIPEENSVQDVLRRYEVSSRTSGLIFREIMKEVKEERHSHKVGQHQDYPQFLKWKEIQKEAACEILENPDVHRNALEERGLDPLKMARLFVDKKQDKASQYAQAVEILKIKKLDHLIGVERTPGYSVEVRSEAKTALIEDWKKAYQDNPNKTLSEGSLLMMAYSNKDVRDLNSQARSHLKTLNAIGHEDVSYTITREVEDDFGRKTRFREKREFSKGDRIVFTHNNMDLGVKNGSMGTILSLDKNTIEVVLDKGALDKGKVFTFSPNMFSFFDQGWAITIHKSQGTTVDKNFLLASHEMNQNLTYVAMTRHREDVHVYGSTLDFWREEKVPQVLSKSGEKLGAADYLDSHSLEKLMKAEDHFLTKLFTRLGDELHAMGAVSKQAFGMVTDHFLGITREKEIRIVPEVSKETPREEERAQDVLNFKNNQEKEIGKDNILSLRNALNDQKLKINHTVQDVYEDWKHPAFQKADSYKRVFEEGLKLYGEEGAIQYWNEKRKAFFALHEKKIEEVEKALESPILGYLSKDTKGLAIKAAFEDPDRTLNRLLQLQETLQKEQDEKNKAASSIKEGPHEKGISPHPSLNLQRDQDLKRQNEEAFFAGYSKFKQLHYQLKRTPSDQKLQEELKEISKSLYENKEMFAHIDRMEPDMGKFIKHTAKSKDPSFEQQKQLQKEIDMDRGFSL